MEIAYTNNRNYDNAFLITKSERKVLVSALKKYKNAEFKKIDKEIESVENDPENEGQVTFKDRIRELNLDKAEINDMIEKLI